LLQQSPGKKFKFKFSGGISNHETIIHNFKVQKPSLNQVTTKRCIWQNYNNTVKVKDKGKVDPVLLTEHHTIKANGGSGGIAPCILDLGIRFLEVSGQLHSPVTLLPGKVPLVPIG